MHPKRMEIIGNPYWGCNVLKAERLHIELMPKSFQNVCPGCWWRRICFSMVRLVWDEERRVSVEQYLCLLISSHLTALARAISTSTIPPSHFLIGSVISPQWICISLGRMPSPWIKDVARSKIRMKTLKKTLKSCLRCGSNTGPCHFMRFEWLNSDLDQP